MTTDPFLPQLIDKKVELAQREQEALLVAIEMLRRHDPDQAQLALAQHESRLSAGGR